MEELIQTFHIDWKLIIAQLVNFAIVLFVLYKFAIKPLSKTMDQRTYDIGKSLEDAKKIEEKLIKIEEEKEAKILQAKSEAQEIIEKSRAQGQIQGQQIVLEAKQEVQTVIAAAKEQIRQEKREMLAGVKAEISELVILTTKKVLEKTINKEINEKLVEESLKDIKR